MENMDRPGFIESLGMPEVHYATLANQVLRRVKRVRDTVHHCVEGHEPPTVTLIGEVYDIMSYVYGRAWQVTMLQREDLGNWCGEVLSVLIWLGREEYPATEEQALEMIDEVIVELKREVESAYEEWEGSQL